MDKKDILKPDNWALFRWGLFGLTCTSLLVYLIFVAISIQYYPGISYTIWAVLGSAFLLCFPNLITGILYYFTGFAFRGKERKSIKLFLEDKTDEEKMILLGIIWKSMDVKPPQFLIGLDDRIKDINL